jgi:hypothetical protein
MVDGQPFRSSIDYIVLEGVLWVFGEHMVAGRSKLDVLSSNVGWSKETSA